MSRPGPGWPGAADTSLPGDPADPADNLLPEDVVEARFRPARPGSDKGQVDAFLGRAADAHNQLVSESEALRDRLRPAGGATGAGFPAPGAPGPLTR